EARWSFFLALAGVGEARASVEDEGAVNRAQGLGRGVARRRLPQSSKRRRASAGNVSTNGSAGGGLLLRSSRIRSTRACERRPLFGELEGEDGFNLHEIQRSSEFSLQRRD